MQPGPRARVAKFACVRALLRLCPAGPRLALGRAAGMASIDVFEALGGGAAHVARVLVLELAMNDHGHEPGEGAEDFGQCPSRNRADGSASEGFLLASL